VKVKKLRSLFESAVADERRNGIQRPTGTRFFSDLKEAFDKGELKPGDFSIRGLLEEFLMDDQGRPCGREIVDSWNPRHGGGSDGENLTQLLEGGAVMASAFSNITGQIIYNTMLETYQLEDFTFTKAIPTVPTQFNGERIPGIGGIGNQAEIVGETQLYPTVGTNEDWIDTPQTTKRGLILPLTKEAAFFDRTGLLLQECAKVGENLGVNKEIRAVDCVIDENTTVHRYNRKNRGPIATFGANSYPHDFNNLVTTNGLTNWVQVDNADQLLYTILDPNTGLPIVITGDVKLIVPRGLLRTAEYINRAGTVAMYNPGFAVSGNPVRTDSPNIAPPFKIMTNRFLVTRMALTTSWYYGVPEKAFAYMENWPLTVVQAPPNSEAEFNQDIVMRWKASERGQFIVRDPRYVVKSTA